MRPRVSVSFCMRPRGEPTFNEENDCIFGFILSKTTHPGQDEAETIMSKIRSNEIRPGRDCPKIFLPR